MIKAPVLSEDEKLGCSLVSRKHPYKELKATIDEACIHQNDTDHKHYQGIIREIFAEIEANWEIYREEHELPKFRYDYGKYQSLKSKYQEEK